MEKRYYGPASLERVLRSFERAYELPSREFYDAHCAGLRAVERIPRFHRHVWASMYRELAGLPDGGFAERVERTLALA